MVLETEIDGSSGGVSPETASNLLQMMTGYWASQAVYVAARLGIADLLADGPKSSPELAAAANCHVSSLRRVLRALASVGVFTEVTSDRFGLTPMSALLQTGTPDSMRSLAIVYGDEMYRAWGDFLHSVETGQPAFEHHIGMGPFAYFAEHPEADRVFNEAMIGYTNRVATAVVDNYDFGSFETVVDVGGGYGTIIAAILQRHPSLQGILFDLPHVVSDAEASLSAFGVADRCARVGGDFFAEIPSGGDAYLLSQILHDWDDDQCEVILRQCRRAIPADGKLLVVELVLPTGEEPSFGKWMDLHMLAITGGRERTADEFDTLFHVAGFALTKVVPTAAGPSVVEAVPI